MLGSLKNRKSAQYADFFVSDGKSNLFRFSSRNKTKNL